MSNVETLDTVSALADQGYKYGFFSDIEADTAPPGSVVAFATATKTHEALGLGSTRTAVERVLGPGAARHTACGTDVVRYVPAQPAMSEASLWFIYRNGRVVAFARYEAV